MTNKYRATINVYGEIFFYCFCLFNLALSKNFFLLFYRKVDKKQLALAQRLLFLFLNKSSVMSDNKNKTGSPDRDKINLSEEYEISYWTKKFGVSADKLRKAVQEVGSSSKKVEDYFKSGKN